MNYNIGDIIEQETFTGKRFVLVTEKIADVKNDRAGFDGIVVNLENEATWPVTSVWGYDDQIIRIVRRAK